MNPIRWACPVLLLLASVAHAGEDVKRFYGYAFALDDGRYLYTELYEQTFVDGKWVRGSTRYLDAKGAEFAKKTLEFGGDRFVPEYRLEIPAQGYAEGISRNDDTIVMVRREGKGEDEETESVEREGTMVADAGMPRLLLANFETLMNGEELPFRVIAPGRLETYKFVAKRIDDTVFEDRPAVVFRVDMDSMLSLFAGPLFFTFDAQTRDMREYRGTTNLRDPEGELYVVRVSYASKPPKEAPDLPPLP